MSKSHTVTVLTCAALIAACARSRVASEAELWVDAPQSIAEAEEAEYDDGDEQEIDLPLDQLPEKVRAAALAALPGLVIECVEVELGKQPIVYDVEGDLLGETWEVEVTASGEVLLVEHDEEDDDDED